MNSRYLIFNERYPDGVVVSRLEYLREKVRCRKTREHITAILVDESVWKQVDDGLTAAVTKFISTNKGA